MSDLLTTASTSCPYCGEPIELVLDLSREAQEYTEDCSVCCRPIVLAVTVADGEIVGLDARQENE
jgi:hypothetical protein